MRKFLILITCLLAFSCAKESLRFKKNDRLTTSEAKQYYDNLSKNQQVKFTNGNIAPITSVITPNWKSTTEVVINSYSMVEVAIAIPKNEISIYHLNGERAKDDLKRSKFSLSRLIVYKDSLASLKSSIITYIPDISYIDKGKSIRENTFAKLNSSFTGYIEFKKMDGVPYRLLRIENGKVIGKYKISNSSMNKQLSASTEMSASSCVPMCTPIFQTICSGPGGPGSGDDSDWICETQEIGQNCTLICSDGGGDNPSPGGPGTPGIFGINGSNAVVQASNFGALIDYVKSMGYLVSDQFKTTLTVDGVTYTGTMTEIYTNDGKVVSAYFHADQSQGPFTGDYYYNIGKGNGSDTSSENPSSFLPETITGTDITWTNGTSSYSSVSAEAIPNLSDTDPEVAAWNDPPQAQYGVKVAPSYSTMYANYPKNSTGGDMPAPDVYTLVGGNILSLYQSNPVAYANACALRVSRALNYSGIAIPYIPGETTSGADGKYYFVSSAHLYNYVKQIFSTTDKVELTAADGGPQGTLFRGKLKNIKGLYIMQPNYPSKFGAMGHATLWTGSMAIGGHDYFNANGGTAKVTVWKLP
ncbi:T6SS effector amidase Tae4 family protein [Pedobacter suwonensis]|uniref:T6SS effector amidase Tae4 family protein n=2 Tax=Pedobacter suwonensis TaxID=332999 RepID=UPI00368A7496